MTHRLKTTDIDQLECREKDSQKDVDTSGKAHGRVLQTERNASYTELQQRFYVPSTQLFLGCINSVL